MCSRGFGMMYQSMKTNTRHSTASTANREVLTEFYAAFNHLVTNRGDRDEVAAVLADGVCWTVATNGDREKRTYTGIDAVVENVAAPVREGSNHVQALPERFTGTGETIVVEGAYAGTVDGETFDIAFVHVYELEDETIQACRAYTDTAFEDRILAR